jgi:hypothetical protein
VELGAVLVGEQVEDEGAGAGKVVGFEASEGEVVGVVVVGGIELVGFIEKGDGGGDLVVLEEVDGALAGGGEGGWGLGGGKGDGEEEGEQEGSGAARRKSGESRDRARLPESGFVG